MADRSPLAFYADDFTGSADLVMQYQRFGLGSLIFLGQPSLSELEAAAAHHPVVGIAGVTRSMERERIRERLVPALDNLAALKPDFLLYKVCSTADSSPNVGSFEPAITWGRNLIGGRPVPVLVAQPNLGRFTVFSNHFAAERGIVYRLDRQPIMSNHPVTPMREADLRRHLEEQIDGPVAGIDVLQLERPDHGLTAYRQATETGARAVVLDAISEADLSRAGHLVLESGQGTHFGVGSGGFGIGIAAALGYKTVPLEQNVEPATGPVLAVSGSCSSLTSDQIAYAVRAGWHGIELEAGESDWENRVRRAAAEARSELAQGRNVVVYTCGENRGRSQQPVDVTMIARGLADVIRDCRRGSGVERVLIAGGDTSGQVVTALQAESLTSTGTVGGATLVFRLHSSDPAVHALEVVLKGGQIGATEFFEVVRTGVTKSTT